MNRLYPIYVRQGRNPRSYKAGFMNAQGETVIAPTFQDARPFSEGLASVQVEQKWGAIDPNGNLVIPCSHTIGLDFFGGVARFEDGSRRGLIARDGTVILKPKRYLVISPFREGLAYASDGKQYGFINLRGVEVIPLFFDDVLEFSDGIAPAKLNGKWGFIDQKSGYVLEPRFDAAKPFSEGLARVSLDGKWGYIDRQGEFLIAPRFAMTLDFRSGLASASLDKRGPYGFIDRSGEFFVDPAYAHPVYFSEGLAAVTPMGQRFSHFINIRGERAFAGEYLGAHDFKDGLCRVSTLETIAYIDHQGHTVWQGPYVNRP